VPLEVLPRAVAADPEARRRVLLLDADGRGLIGALVEPLEVCARKKKVADSTYATARRARHRRCRRDGVVAEGLLASGSEVEDHEIVRALQEHHRFGS
jgi:hypothetical protein